MTYIRLPKRRERARSGIARAPQREWPRHRKHIRTLECAAFATSFGCMGRVQCAHVRHETDGGTAIKPSDWWTLPLCEHHHFEQHDMGEPAFEARYKIDMKAIALGLARISPDLAMREAARAAGAI